MCILGTHDSADTRCGVTLCTVRADLCVMNAILPLSSPSHVALDNPAKTKATAAPTLALAHALAPAQATA